MTIDKARKVLSTSPILPSSGPTYLTEHSALPSEKPPAATLNPSTLLLSSSWRRSRTYRVDVPLDCITQTFQYRSRDRIRGTISLRKSPRTRIAESEQDPYKEPHLCPKENPIGERNTTTSGVQSRSPNFPPLISSPEPSAQRGAVARSNERGCGSAPTAP